MLAARCTRLVIAVAAVSAALWGVLPGRAEACTCLPPTVEASYNNNSDVVRARILLRSAGATTTLYVARVQRVFKGCLTPNAFVVLRTPSSSAECGALLNVNTDYLVNGEDDGTFLGLRRLAISLCDYNVRVSELSEHDRDFLAGRSVCCGDRCTCADGSQPVQCFVDPCQVAPPCSAGECVANYCGGCNAEFYDANGYAVCQGGCETDEDCPNGSWCRQSEPETPGSPSAGSECVPLVGEGESCGGFRPAWIFERCTPELVCDTPDDVVDATGVCRAPCKSDADCAAEQYCASDSLCEPDSRCERDVDCNLEGNQYPHIECVGHGVCENYSCGWQCRDPQCLDLTGYNFGPCEAILGWGVMGDACTQISGCSSGPFQLFASAEECEQACPRPCAGDDCAPEPSCTSDRDCQVTGCSGQVCAPEPVITTCEFRPEYACYQDPAITSCGCRAGSCAWAQTPELAACIEEASGAGQ